MSEDERCPGRVYPQDGPRLAGGFPCYRRGRFEHKGQLYCKTHHPPTREAKEQERRIKAEAESSKEYDAAVRRDAIRAAEHRLAEAALKAEVYYYDRNQEWVITANEAGREFIEALGDLRRLKGEG